MYAICQITSQESVLRDWHELHPPSTKDIQRNQDIFLEQNNRNPFVDYPQLLNRIQSVSTTSTAPTLDSVYVSTDTIYFKNLVKQKKYTYPKTQHHKQYLHHNCQVFLMNMIMC